MTLVLWLLLHDEVADLIDRLGHRDIEIREEATCRLKAMGKKVETRLRAVVTSDEEVKDRLEVVLRYLAALRTSAAVVVTFQVDESGEFEVLARGEDDLLRLRPPFDRLRREGIEHGYELFTCVIVMSAPTEWHPKDFAGWREVVLRDLDRPIETDIPDVYHLLTRARGFKFALEKLKSIKTDDPVMKRVIERAIKRQEEDE